MDGVHHRSLVEVETDHPIFYDRTSELVLYGNDSLSANCRTSDYQYAPHADTDRSSTRVIDDSSNPRTTAYSYRVFHDRRSNAPSHHRYGSVYGDGMSGFMSEAVQDLVAQHNPIPAIGIGLADPIRPVSVVGNPASNFSFTFTDTFEDRSSWKDARTLEFSGHWHTILPVRSGVVSVTYRTKTFATSTRVRRDDDVVVRPAEFKTEILHGLEAFVDSVLSREGNFWYLRKHLTRNGCIAFLELRDALREPTKAPPSPRWIKPSEGFPGQLSTSGNCSVLEKTLAPEKYAVRQMAEDTASGELWKSSRIQTFEQSTPDPNFLTHFWPDWVRAFDGDELDDDPRVSSTLIVTGEGATECVTPDGKTAPVFRQYRAILRLVVDKDYRLHRQIEPVLFGQALVDVGLHLHNIIKRRDFTGRRRLRDLWGSLPAKLFDFRDVGFV